MSVGFIPPPDASAGRRVLARASSSTDRMLILLTVSPKPAPDRDQRLMEASHSEIILCRWSLVLFPGSLTGVGSGCFPVIAPHLNGTRRLAKAGKTPGSGVKQGGDPHLQALRAACAATDPSL